MKLLKKVGDIVSKSIAFGDYIDVVQPSVYRGGMSNGSFFFGGGGIDYRFAYSSHSSALNAYQQCPPLAAVINRKAQCYINGITQINNTLHKESQSPDAKRLRALLLRPNYLQTWKQFEAQQYIYVQLFGFCITIPIIPVGYESLGPTYATSFWNIPPYMLSIAERQKIFFYADNLKDCIEYIRLNYKGLQTDLPLENLFIFKDFTPSPNSYFFPESRVKSMEMPVNNIIGAYISRNELINYAGAQGLMSPEGEDSSGSIPLKEEEKQQLQDDMKRQYGIQRGQWRYIIAPAAMKWTGIGKPTKDLMLFEEVSDDIMRICDGYNYPSPLLNSEKGPNVSNVDAYKAQIYTDGIIPESQDMYEQWNAYLNTAKYNIIMEKSYAHVPVLQDDKVKAGQALYYLNQSNMLLWEANLMTANEVRASNEMDPVAGWDIYINDFKRLGIIVPMVTNDPNKKPDDENAQEDDAEGGKEEPGDSKKKAA